MKYNTSDEWVIDLEQMTCESIINKIVIKFEKEGEAIIGKIRNMPVELVKKLAREMTPEANEHKPIREAILEAEELFLHTYFENMIESGNKILIKERRKRKRKAVVLFRPLPLRCR